MEQDPLFEKVAHLISIGIALSAERDTKKLLEKILLSAKLLTHSDGGTLYTVSQNRLHFEIVTSDSLHYHLGGTSGLPINIPDIPLFLADGQYNESAIVAHATNYKKVVNIKDAYHETGFDFSGPKKFDEAHGYRTKSVLAVPIQNHEGDVIGVLQLINSLDPKTSQIKSFTEEDQFLAESLASQAGIAVTNQRLIVELKNLFDSFIKVISRTVDEKSPSTGNHSRRVSILCTMLAHAVTESGLKIFSPEEIEELKTAAILHDCGKITTPVHVQEKHTKLETIFDRQELISTRFEVLKKEEEKKSLEKKLKWYEEKFPQAGQDFKTIDQELEKKLSTLCYEEEFLRKCNHSFTVTPAMSEEIAGIATNMWKYKNELVPLLSSDEVENLSLPYGTLTDKERKIIENHVVLTIKMLSEVPFPKNLKNVAAIAGAHHERIDGKGYPNGLTKDQMLLQARILAIADIFEALSAPDRPYKEPLKLSTIYQILNEKAKSGHIDPDLLAIFINQNVALKYAQEHLAPEQIDVKAF